MSDSIKKYNEITEGERRAMAIGQNGNDGLHYVQDDTSVKESPLFSIKVKKTLLSLNSLLNYKNDKYGNAALSPLKIFEGKCKVGQRLDDKLSRVKNSKGLKKNDVADLIGYLTLVCVEKGWENFDEFKD